MRRTLTLPLALSACVGLALAAAAPGLDARGGSASEPIAYADEVPFEDTMAVLDEDIAERTPPPPPPTTTTTAPPPTTTTTAPPPPPPPPAPPVTEAPSEPAPSTGTGYADPGNYATWDRLAECESGGNWAINTGNGYYGGLQFSLGSWQGVGGTGMPHEASRETQIQMGQRLQASGGWGHWPACSSKLGYR